MKSILQEASSLAKAIEQGWVKAGKPKEFSVKIYEEPEKNFFGLTTKNAKVGIFYHDKQQTPHERYPRKHMPQQRRFHHRRDQWRKGDGRHQAPQQEHRAQDERQREERMPQSGADRRQEHRPQQQPRPQQERQPQQIQQRELKPKPPSDDSNKNDT